MLDMLPKFLRSALVRPVSIALAMLVGLFTLQSLYRRRQAVGRLRGYAAGRRDFDRLRRERDGAAISAKQFRDAMDAISR